MVTEDVHPYAGHWWPPGHIIGYEHGFVHVVYELIQSIVEDKPFVPDFSDGVECQRVLEAVDHSIETGSWWRLKTYNVKIVFSFVQRGSPLGNASFS